MCLSLVVESGELDSAITQARQGDVSIRSVYETLKRMVRKVALVPDVDDNRRRSWAGLPGEVRLGVRTLRRSPLYAVGVAGTLGLGLAAAMLVFAVAWTVWLAPMPYPDPERVIRLYEVEPADAAAGARQAIVERRQPLSAPLLEDLRARSWRTIGAVAAVADGVAEWARDGETVRIAKLVVSPELFGILGIVPTLGTFPTDEANAEVVLTERFWRTNFGADPDVVGSVDLRLNGRAERIVGVARLPAGYPGEADIVEVAHFPETDDLRSLRYLDAIARVRPGHSAAEAKAEVTAFVAALDEIHPQHRGWGMDAVVLADDLLRPFRGVIALLLAAGAVFLLLAAVNVAGLVGARRVDGRHDRSIRLALGASEGRLLRGSLVESLVLAGIGSIAGVLGAYGLIGPVRALVPHDVPRLDELAVTPALALGGLSVGLLLALVIGAAGYLVSRGAGPSVGRAPAWRAVGAGGRRALVVGQVALTTVLTAGGAAILHRASTLRAMDLGFEAEGVWTTSAVLGSARYPSRQARWTAWRAILDGLHARRVPAAVAFNTPMSGQDEDVGMFPIRADAASEEVFYRYHAASEAYFSVMGIDVLRGRVFGPADYASSADVAIVSEEFVDRYFPPETPIESVVGRVIGRVPAGGGARSPTVIGVVESTRHLGPDAPVAPDLYMPLSQWFGAAGALLVRGDADQFAEAVSTVLSQVDPDLRWTPLVPYTSYLDEWFAPLRLQIIMIGVLGALGLLLASLGLYALMAYQVASRRQELGIRKAVGATDGRLMWGVLARGAVMASVGALIGLAAWYRLLPVTGELVEGVGSAGRLVPLTVALVIVGSSLVATLVPAVRATRVDPVVTLEAD